jgi:hypothetical protein
MSVNNYDVDLYEAVEDLVESGWLDEGTPPYGITHQAIHLACESLSDKQRFIYKQVVERALAKRHGELDAIRNDLSNSL